jgi:hypothetical protein
MRILHRSPDNIYLSQNRKRDSLVRVIAKVDKIVEGSYKCAVIRACDNLDTVGHHAEVERFRHRINWKRFNLIIITIESPAKF